MEVVWNLEPLERGEWNNGLKIFSQDIFYTKIKSQTLFFFHFHDHDAFFLKFLYIFPSVCVFYMYFLVVWNETLNQSFTQEFEDLLFSSLPLFLSLSLFSSTYNIIFIIASFLVVWLGKRLICKNSSRFDRYSLTLVKLD